MAFLLAFLPGCVTVGPDYTPPTEKVPEKWDLPDDPALTPEEPRVRQWWNVFHDPVLTNLIQRAAQGNLDLKSAMARVDQARYQIGVVTGDAIPSLGGEGGSQVQRISEYGYSPGGTAFWSHSASLQSSWEIDLFGRIRRSIEAAQADYQASQEDRVDVLITLYSEVAQAYLTVRTTQARLKAAHRNMVSQQAVLDLTKVLFKNGLASGLDLSQADSVLASSQAEIPQLRDTLDQALNSLTLLLGLPPGSLRDELREPKPIPLPGASVALGAPADLLRRRPDIRRAERRLAAATARIGVVTADLYPSFTLTGSIGLSAANGGDLFRSGSHFYSAGPGFSWNLFQGGSLRNQIKVNEAETREALYTYELAVLNALNETDGAFRSYRHELDRLAALERTVDTQRKTLELAVELFKQGLQDFQSVLDAQRQLFTYDDQKAQSQGQAATNLVLLYKALGGGWRAPAGKPAGVDPDKAPKPR
jgi:NodT family efflux transporter outer membrane factor (OMF) lipoprotein